jgi:hypothetical protein
MKGAFATRLAGSADLYNTNGRKPFHSINFVVAHDGFSLYDLCAYTCVGLGLPGPAWAWLARPAAAVLPAAAARV